MVGELSDSLQIPLVIRAEAAAWLARLRAQNRSPADEQAFQNWLAADPAHAAAFEAVDAVWDVSGGLPRDLRGGVYRREPTASRRAALTGLGALIVAGGSISFWQSARANVYQTEVGEQKHVSLQDGTEVLLDTDTRLVVDFSLASRLVNLEYGRANFRVTPDVRRPFTVRAADRLIVVGHSTFDVRRDGDRVSVVIIQGRAAVQSGKRPADQLSDGQQLIVTPAQTVRLGAPNLLPLLAWQTGQAIFENESLSEAATEMNRYSMVKLEVDPAIENLKVSGVYRVGENATFARSVAKLLPVEMRQGEDRIELFAEMRNSQG